MKNPVGRIWTIVGATLLAASVSVAPIRADCDTSGIGSEFGVVCLSVQQKDENTVVLRVDPKQLELNRGSGEKTQILWLVAGDSVSQTMKWRIKWVKTAETVDGHTQVGRHYDPLEKGGFHPHTRIIKPGAGRSEGKPTGLDKHPGKIEWTYTVEAKVDGHWQLSEDPIILWPGG
jgi:hypothetical protein